MFDIITHMKTVVIFVSVFMALVLKADGTRSDANKLVWDYRQSIGVIRDLVGRNKIDDAVELGRSIKKRIKDEKSDLFDLATYYDRMTIGKSESRFVYDMVSVTYSNKLTSAFSISSFLDRPDQFKAYRERRFREYGFDDELLEPYFNRLSQSCDPWDYNLIIDFVPSNLDAAADPEGGIGRGFAYLGNSGLLSQIDKRKTKFVNMIWRERERMKLLFEEPSAARVFLREFYERTVECDCQELEISYYYKSILSKLEEAFDGKKIGYSSDATIFLDEIQRNSYSYKHTLKGVVSRVSDGDTIWVTDGSGKKVKVRLDRIDAPESDQPYGRESRDYLESLIGRRNVSVMYNDKDRYGRILGIVWVGGRDVNLQMVRAGMAWHYDYFDKTRSYAEAHRNAQANRLGLWADPNPVNPYQWRK